MSGPHAHGDHCGPGCGQTFTAAGTDGQPLVMQAGERVFVDPPSSSPLPVTDGRPALAWLLGKQNLDAYDPDRPETRSWPHVGPNGECAECPFGTPSCERDPHEYAPNPADPGEGNYDCSLLGRLSIWGENPRCEHSDWVARARVELAGGPIEQEAAAKHSREQVLAFLRRTRAAVVAADYPWVVVELEQLAGAVRWGKADATAMWAAILAAD